ncbi:MAG: hydroxymethylbilane synthase [Planctomycetota bacterium]|nr:MAG: hydroxymethylbilane synthase [Planctomycetota bacterium]
MTPGQPLRIGTRVSKLARWQSDWVAGQLQALGAAVEIVEIATQGDVQQTGPVADMGVQGLFTKEIQAALLDRRVDLAVHSFKDLPTQPIAGLALAAAPPREDSADALVANVPSTLATLPRGARVGTGSLRRRAQLLHLRPDLQIIGIRGNVDTRLRKLDDGAYDAIALAAAGLRRLGWSGRIQELLAPPRMLPAPGQGALALECRGDDQATRDLVSRLDDGATRLSVAAERAVLAALHGGCSAPIAAWGRIEKARLCLTGLVADVDGRQVLRAEAHADVTVENISAAMTAAVELGRQVADALLAQGAAALIQAARTG